VSILEKEKMAYLMEISNVCARMDQMSYHLWGILSREDKLGQVLAYRRSAVLVYIKDRFKIL